MKNEQGTAEIAENHGLKVIRGGKGGDGPDWLADIPPGRFFLARPRVTPDGQNYNGFTLLEFYTGGWQGRARVVAQEDPNTGAHHTLTVDSARFSNTMELFDILEGPQKEEETEQDNEQRDLPRPG